jgi:signal transduction histidine kinase
MAATATRLVPSRLTRLPARSARLRLTLLYSGMFLALGTAIVVVIFLIGSGSGAVSVTAAPSPQGAGAPAVHAAISEQHSADVNRLLAGAWVTLALTAAASAVLGWFLAGRVLRPLRQMTATARTISSGNLHERLRLAGPGDEFKQLGDTFDDLLARLEGSFAAQRRFVANAAHELRTPLTVERTLLQVALADPNASAASLRATCEELLASGRGQERLLEALLTLASSERGPEDRQPIDLAAIAARALAGARSDLKAQQLELRTDLGPGTVLGDPALVERLVANLIENAVHYNRAGGLIEVETATRSGRAVLSVANTGPIVPADAVERLFEPFQRLERERTTSGGPHGLGLSIVRAVAIAHDAEVVAQPRAEGGLSVTVRFPPAQDQAQ